MFLKSSLVFFTLIATSVCLAKDHKTLSKEQSVGHLTNAEYIHQVLSDTVARKHQTPPQKTQQGAFHAMLDHVQKQIDLRLNRLDASSALAPLTTIEEELTCLEGLWSSFLANPSLNNVVSYCQNTFAKAKTDIGAAATDAAKRTLLQSAWANIGEAVFLAERYPQEMASFIDPSSFASSQQKILARCQREMQSQVAACQSYFQAQKNAQLQNAGLALSMYQPHVIASMLLTSTGKLNLGMISLIRSAFIPATSPLEYEEGIDRVLSSMNCSWQPLFDSILAPSPQNSASQEIIRSNLNLSRSTTLTDYHSKWTALKALLSQLNQGAVGDCFAVSWAIKKHDEYLTQSIKDYGELLQNGYLTRAVNGSSDQFFFKNTLADSDLQNPINLGSDGSLGQVMLWQAPGIVAACRQMGIEDVQGTMQTALQGLFTQGDPAQTTPEAIIECFANYSASQSGTDPALQLLRGKYAFSLTQNQLLRAWETALAAMAEAARGDSVRDQVIAAVEQALANQWAAFKANLSADLAPVVDQMHNAFDTTFNQMNRFVYDADIPLAQVSADGSSSDGGFELYARLPAQPLTMGQRIETPDDFRNYLIQIVNQTSNSLQKLFPSYSATYLQIANGLISYMKQDVFLKDTFYAYDDQNKQVPDPVTNYKNLSNTPMTTLQGDDPFAVEAIDTGVTFLPDTKTINPQNSYQLVKWILDLAKWKEQTQHYLEDGIPDELDPATSPQHAFNIAFEESDISSFVVSNQTSDQWIQAHVLNPNLPIAKALASKQFKSSFSNNLIQWLTQNQVPSQTIQSFSRSIDRINNRNMTRQAYASSVLSLLSQTFGLDANKTKEVSIVFDMIFLQSLPAQAFNQISKSVIRFAKTNWDDGDKNIYFCVFFNPRTAALSFGSIDEDKTNLSIMDEYQWIDQQTWQVVPIEENIASAM